MKLPINKNNIAILTIVTIAIVFWILYSKNFYPVIFADEWFYNRFSRLELLQSCPRPVYFYLAFYKITNFFGQHYLIGMRLINALFFGFGTLFFYSTSAKFIGHRQSLLLSLIVLFSPFAFYQIYFMPESMQYFGFYLFVWILFGLYETNSKLKYSYEIMLGVALALMTLVKPHAILWLPASITAMWFLQREKKGYASTLKSILVYIFSLSMARILIGFSFAGSSGLSLFGTEYSNLAASAANEMHFQQYIPRALFNLAGHLVGLIVIFGLPIVFMVKALTNRQGNYTQNSGPLIFLATLLLTIIPIIILFAVKAATTGPYESITRLSLRYYDYSFPLFLLIAGIFRNANISLKLSEMLIAVIVILLAGFYGLSGYTIIYSDAPDLVLFSSKSILYIFAILSSMLVWAAYFRVRRAYFIYLFIVIPVYIGISFKCLNSELANSRSPNLYDRVGLSLQGNPAYSDNFGFISDDLAGLYRQNFYSSGRNTPFYYYPKDSVIKLMEISRSVKYYIVLGRYSMPKCFRKLALPENLSLLGMEGYELTKECDE